MTVSVPGALARSNEETPGRHQGFLQVASSSEYLIPYPPPSWPLRVTLGSLSSLLYSFTHPYNIPSPALRSGIALRFFWGRVVVVNRQGLGRRASGWFLTVALLCPYKHKITPSLDRCQEVWRRNPEISARLFS